MSDLKDQDDPRLSNAARNIESDVRDVFGPDSPESRDYEHYNIWSGGMYMGMPPHEQVRARTQGLAAANVAVQSLIARVNERLPVGPGHGSGTPPVEPGIEMIGNWRVIKHLRRDGQGEVLLVERTGPAGHALGVLKRVPRDVSADAKRLARFKHEIDFARRLRHPFIAEVLDTNLDGEMWFVTRFARLGSLADNLGWFKGDAWRTLRMARDVATALGVAHEKQVIHRDVKPGNVLLYDPNHVALTDFGIAHHPDHTVATEKGEKVGPGWFLPPEAEHGRRDDVEPHPTHDVYMLGKLTYYVAHAALEVIRGLGTVRADRQREAVGVE